MKNILVILLAILGLFGAIFFIANQSGGDSSSAQTYYGDRYSIGDGYAYTWIKMDATKQLIGIGVNIDDEALASLPTEEQFYQFSMMLPKETASTPFKHVLFDWNPQGHEPPGIYDLPHFDAHFYSINEAERLAIAPDDVGFEIVPLDGHIPVPYEKIPGGVPQMGAHWFDPRSAEFNGETFTETFIYGSYDGEVIFVEPMLTLAMLESKPNLTKSIPMPEKFDAKWSSFPTQYSIQYMNNKGEYSISLHGFMK